MTAQLYALSFAANHPGRLAHFWTSFLGWEVVDSVRPDAHASVTIRPQDDTGFLIRFLATDQPKTTPNQTHFDLTSTSLDDQQEKVDRALALGARHLDVGQRPEEGHVVLADPEGNEFCIVEPDNNFLAGRGLIGALSGDGLADVGHFWSAALGWPLIWDQDGETAISPASSSTSTHTLPPILSWGGPPVQTKTGRNRWHYDLTVAYEHAVDAEVERLSVLGATRLGSDAGGRVQLADPGGNEFCLMVRPVA